MHTYPSPLTSYMEKDKMEYSIYIGVSCQETDVLREQLQSEANINKVSISLIAMLVRTQGDGDIESIMRYKKDTQGVVILEYTGPNPSIVKIALKTKSGVAYFSCATPLLKHSLDFNNDDEDTQYYVYSNQLLAVRIGGCILPTIPISRLHDHPKFASIFSIVLSEAIKDASAYIYSKEEERWMTTRARLYEGAVNSLEETIMNNTEEIIDLQRRIRVAIDTQNNARLCLEQIHSLTSIKRSKELRDELNQLNSFRESGKIRSFNLTTDRFEFVTSEVTLIDEDNNGDEILFGPFTVVVHFNEGNMGHSLTFKSSRSHPSKASSYIHPHIQGSGNPCFGNIQGTIYDLVSQRKLGDLVLLIVEFLWSYNPQNPFILLRKFNIDDRQPNHDWNACFDEVGPSECLDCRESDCPFWNERYDNCRERRDDDECKACNYINCEFRDWAMNECHSRNSNIYCLDTCTNDYCKFYEDYDHCFEESTDEECQACTIELCDHSPDRSDHNDVTETEPETEDL